MPNDVKCKHYDPINGWCKKLSDWSDPMPHIVYCPKSPCEYAEPIEQPMTDNDIIKALECCHVGKRDHDCKKCPLYRRVPACVGHLTEAALDLVNRQKAEIERLKAMIEAAEDHYNPLPFKGIFDEKIAEVKAEAVKAFSEGLNEYIDFITSSFYTEGVVPCIKAKIEQFVKEMTEEKE